MYWKSLDRYSKDLEAIRGRGVTVSPTPRPVLEAQLKAWGHGDHETSRRRIRSSPR
jgi:TRAP-type mannitol/chloroaromatic compound transport system substrate-binding protein